MVYCTSTTQFAVVSVNESIRVVNTSTVYSAHINYDVPEEIDMCNVLFNRWYTRDDNAMPSAYVLSPISSLLPDFLSHDDDRKNAAKYTWWAESERIQTALYVTATKIFNKEIARKYIMSGNSPKAFLFKLNHV